MKISLLGVFASLVVFVAALFNNSQAAFMGLAVLGVDISISGDKK